MKTKKRRKTRTISQEEIIRIIEQERNQKIKPEKKKSRKVKKQKATITPEIKREKPVDTDYQRRKSLYEQQINQLDYGKLFEYMGAKKEYPYQSYLDGMEHSPTKRDVELTEEHLERIIRREQTNLMLRNNLDQIDVQEKERYIYWKMFNRMWNMIKINLARVGEGTPGVFYV